MRLADLTFEELGGDGGHGIGRVRTDADGHFELYAPWYCGGDFQVRTQLSDGAPLRAVLPRVDGLAYGEEPADVGELPFEPKRLLLAGRVIDERGQAVRADLRLVNLSMGARLVCKPRGGKDGKPFVLGGHLGYGPWTWFTDAEGGFRFEGWASGQNVRLEVVTEGEPEGEVSEGELDASLLVGQLIPVNAGPRKARDFARWYCEHHAGAHGRAVVVGDVVAALGYTRALFELRREVRSHDPASPVLTVYRHPELEGALTCGRARQSDQVISRTIELPPTLAPRQLFEFYCALYRSPLGAATATGRVIKIRDRPDSIEVFELGLRSFVQLQQRGPVP